MQANSRPSPQSIIRTSRGSPYEKTSKSRLRVIIASRARSIRRSPSRRETARTERGRRNRSSGISGRALDRGPRCQTIRWPLSLARLRDGVVPAGWRRIGTSSSSHSASRTNGSTPSVAKRRIKNAASLS